MLLPVCALLLLPLAVCLTLCLCCLSLDAAEDEEEGAEQQGQRWQWRRPHDVALLGTVWLRGWSERGGCRATAQTGQR